MPRVKRGVHARKKRRGALEQAKGYYGSRSKRFRVAREQLLHSGQYAYRDRRAKKRDFRRLWITRIGAATRQHGMSYSTFMAGLKRAEVDLNRKVLADIAARDPDGFAGLVDVARRGLGS
ncbi:MAG: 50S ribosomal protein L20 [Actinomycetota bacterium]